MRNKRALTLLLAASMLIPQFAVFTSAASDYNYIKIEEEMPVGSTFDEAPTIKSDAGRPYHKLGANTWMYQPNGGASVLAHNSDGYLSLTTGNYSSNVAYSFGTVRAGEYKASMDIYPEADSGITGIRWQFFHNLDGNFDVGNSKYVLHNQNYNLKAGEWNNISATLDIPEDTTVAFRIYVYFDDKVNTSFGTAGGSFRIDNLYLGRPADILIEPADLTSVDVSKAYTGADDTTLPAGKWVATDNTRLTLTGGNTLSATRAESDKLLQTNASIVYVFPDEYPAGKYRLTADVNSNGTLQVASVKGTWSAIKNASKSGNTYTAEFELTEDKAGPVAFRFWPSASTDAAAFSISNVKLEYYNSGTFDPNVISWKIVEENDFSKEPTTEIKSDWKASKPGTWNAKANPNSGIADISWDGGQLVITNANRDSSQNVHPGIAYQFPSDLTAGTYRLNLKYRFDGINSTNYPSGVPTHVRVFIREASGTNAVQLFETNPTLTNEEFFSLKDKVFELKEEYEGEKVYLRIYLDNRVLPAYYVDDYKLERKVVGAVVGEKWEVVYDSTTADGPKVINDTGINYDNSKANKNTWFVRINSNAIGAVALKYENKTLNVTARDTAIHGKPAVMYRFNNTLAKGNYSIETEIKTLATVGEGDTYTLSLHFSNGQEPVTLAQAVAKNSAVPVTIDFALESDSEVVLCIQSTTGYTFTSAFEVSSLTVSKLSNPLIQLRSNADLASFDSEDGVYYMAVNAQSDIYVNYFANTEFRPGYYVLSGDFRTADEDGAELSAYFVNQSLDVKTIEAGDDWQPFEFPITLKRDTALSASRTIRFEVDSSDTLYFRNLKLVFVEDLPKPAINPAIAMILLKKIEGTYPGHIITKPIEYAINGDFDTEVKIDHDQSRGYLKHADGRWTYSKNSGDVKTSIVNDGTNSYAYFEVANANPNVGYRVGVLPAGKYTVSFDIYPEYSIGSIRTRIYRLADGFAVGKTDYVIADNTSAIKVGQKNTLTYNFVLEEETTVAFGFYATKENPCPEKGNFRLDNVSVLKRP